MSIASVRQSFIVSRTRRWSGISTGPAGALSWHAASERKDGGHEVVRLHALDVERVALPALAAQDRQGAVEVPAPAGGEHGAAQHGLGSGVLHVMSAQERGHVLEREAVLGPERQEHGVVAGRRLELEVEVETELLAQAQAQRAVDP